MKKSFLALAALAAFGGAAHAQSSVTLFGIVDAGFTYTNNNGGHSSWQMTSSNEQSTRWGLRGVEDLGSGLKAIFQLESGFSLVNGTAAQGGRLFGRQAWVGLSSDKYGTLTLGRQYNAMQDFIAPLQITTSTSLTVYGTHPLDNDNLGNTYRTNNEIKYTTQNYSGFQGEATYAFSNSTSFAVNRAYSVGATYSGGAVSLAAAYVRLSNPAFNKDTVGAIPSDNFYSLTTMPFLATAATVQQWGAAGTYSAGNAIFGLLYTGSLFGNPTAGSLFSGATGSGGGSGSVRFQNLEGSARYYFTPFLLASVGETYTHATQGSGSGNYWQTSAGFQYFLSKRTDLYVNAFYQKTSQHLHAWLNTIGAPSTTSTQVVAVVGIRHKF
ncbi:porin [Paraburkholderia domus]|uniref:Outer membrane porin protein n=1 Tax=Paraburkholderia domus TaxID=2793075 RepID=A0A9N8R8F1_9BURK|nr:porin [Paraburkholderia domus]MBK5053743.1 porin [Burkholderia sp. R-70006]MBK5065607.1 porin [Burkholderia sp. R-70199]MBK5122247.1 porin [Burkholderia sp. R-69980]MBK5169778.1 porin [Burkholderia sp. R-70211]MBK5185247.1 porin [Burkholderia sp. R-69749]